jgi:hypothetical protein
MLAVAGHGHHVAVAPERCFGLRGDRSRVATTGVPPSARTAIVTALRAAAAVAMIGGVAPVDAVAAPMAVARLHRHDGGRRGDAERRAGYF